MITRRFHIQASHPALPGHFPGAPIVPGVLLLDQLAIALRESGSGRLASLVQVKYLAPLLPERDAVIEIEAQGAMFAFRIRDADTLLAEGRIEVAQ